MSKDSIEDFVKMLDDEKVSYAIVVLHTCNTAQVWGDLSRWAPAEGNTSLGELHHIIENAFRRPTLEEPNDPH